MIDLIGETHRPYHYVDTDTSLTRLAGQMRKVRRIAVDTESDSMYHYFPKVCLIQLTLEGQDYIIDALAGVDLSGFLQVLSRKPIIFHGGDYDLRMLRSSFGFVPHREVFDTMLAGQLIGYEQLGLAALVKRFFNVEISKKGQKSDWSRRPLASKLLGYASGDTHYLGSLANKLESRLRKLGRIKWHRQACERMVRSTAQENHVDPDRQWRIKGVRQFGRRELSFVHQLWHWRESQAKQVDVPPFKIMGNKLILDLAVWASSHSVRSLGGGPKLPRNFRGQRLAELEKVIKKAKQMPESKWPRQREYQEAKRSYPDRKRMVEALKGEVVSLADKLGIDASVLAPRAAIKAIAANRPKTLEETIVCSDLMRWQGQLLRPAIKKVLKN